jgi:predicted RNase H-related nuclease YkuK (DUF458 family)
MKKTILIIAVILIAAITIGYGATILYDIVMTDVTIRLKQAIAEGVEEGIREGLGSVVNPISWAQKLVR